MTYIISFTSEEFIKLKQVPAIGQQLKKNILVEEREFMRMERELKKIGPQADEVGEQQLPAIGQQLKEIGPQADGGCDE